MFVERVGWRDHCGKRERERESVGVRVPVKVILIFSLTVFGHF